MRKIYNFHHILFAVGPVLFLFAMNIKTVQLTSLFPLLIATFLICTILYRILKICIKNNSKASLIESVFFIIFFSYGYFFDFLRTTPIDSILKGKHWPVFIAVILFLIGFVIHILHRKSNFYNTTRVLDFTALGFVIIPVCQIVLFYLSYTPFDFDISKLSDRVMIDYSQKTPNRNRPDIYYFIFDRYADNKTLKDYYDYDNTEFTEYLKKKGFYVAQNSRANYISTELSLSSSLNMVHLDSLAQLLGSNSADLRPLSRMIEDNELLRFFKAQGYFTYHVGSWWAPTAYNRYADNNINIPSLSEFTEVIYHKTILYPIMVNFKIPFFDNRKNQWSRELYELDEIAKIPNDEKPTFTFAHFLITHPPYVFDKDGKYITEEESNKKGTKQNYKDLVQFANKKIREIIDAIIQKSGSNPPIIIIQSDEGPYPEIYDKDTKHFDWTHAGDDTIQEKMGILNAYYLPFGGESKLYEDITPANSFRIILNYYFNQKLALLSDTLHLSNLEYPYRFTILENSAFGKKVER